MGHGHLGIGDIIVFAISLSLSIGVGIFYMWREKKMSTKRAEGTRQSSKTMDFLVGGRKLPLMPVMLSILTTFLSGITLLGTPAEVYQRGALFLVWYLMAPVCLLISAYFFVPIFYQFRPISIYEYFELRFNSRALRRVAASLFLLNTIFYMAVVIYAPAVAISGVTNLELNALIITVALVCTFYTSIGGLKAVVWTDSIQAVFMYAGIITVMIMGTNASGGLSRVWRIGIESRRWAPLANINPDPAQYCSIWSAIIGGFTYWTGLYGLNQMAMQRYTNMATLQLSYRVIGITIPFFIVLGLSCSFIGIVMVAYFYDCDPLISGDIKSKDQLVILMVVETLGRIPGLAGVFVACLFSGTLSSVSSGINSMTAVIWEDFLKIPLGHWSDNKTTWLIKAMSVGLGLLSMVLAFCAGSLGGLVSATLTVLGGITGPLLGIFFLGFFMPKSNKYGCFVGLSISIVVCLWIGLGSWTNKMYRTFTLPLNNSLCTNVTHEFDEITYDRHSQFGDTTIFYPYRISNYLFGAIGLVLTFVIGGLVSILTPSKYLKESSLPVKKFSNVDAITDEPIKLYYNCFGCKEATPTFV